MTENNEADDQLDKLLKIRSIHELLLKHLDYEKIENVDDDRESKRIFILKEVQRIQKEKKLFKEDYLEIDLLNGVVDEVLGFGPLETLLRDRAITDILVNQFDEIFVEKMGKLYRTSLRFIDEEHVYRLLQKETAKSGYHIDLGNPHVNAQLPDGSRLHAVIPPLAVGGTKISIRKFMLKKLDSSVLLSKGTMTEDMFEFLNIAVKARMNIVICGGTGSGKTTLLNLLLNCVSEKERVLVIEDTTELEPSHHHVVRLLTRQQNPEGKGGITQDDLMIDALRMRPDRVILGELRGAEAFNLLHAMNTGQDGSMVTLHASGTQEAFARLSNMILMAKYSLSSESITEQIAGALDLVIYQARLVDGSRKIMNISLVNRGARGQIEAQHFYKYEIDTITPHELKGRFLRSSPPLTERFENKLIISGLYGQYKKLMDNIIQSSVSSKIDS